MAVTVSSVATGSNDAGNPSPLVISKPTGTVDGDLLIAHISSLSAATWPAGWTDIDTVAASNHSSLKYKVAASEGTDYSWPAGGRATGVIYRISGAAIASFINAHSTKTNASGTDAPATTITPTVANCGIFYFVASGAGGACSGYGIATSSPSFTEYSDSSYGGVNALEASAFGLRPQTTATGAGSATLSSAGDNITHLLAIAPGLDVAPPAPLFRVKVFFYAPIMVRLFRVAVRLLTATLPLWNNQTKHSSTWNDEQKSS